MEILKLITPTAEYKEQILEYKKDFIDNGDNLAGSGGLREIDSFDEWLSSVINHANEETVPQNLVPSNKYIAIRLSDNKLVGMIDIRHRLNDYLIKFGGHIGYSVIKSERRKGYAKEMLRLGLIRCKELNIDKVLITCNHDNIASENTILSCGGVFENEIQNGDIITKRFWINL